MSDAQATAVAEIKRELMVLGTKLDEAATREATVVAKLQALIDGPKDTSAIDGDLAEILATIKGDEGKADALGQDVGQATVAGALG